MREKLYYKLKFLLAIILRSLWIKHIRGISNIPQASRVIIACNHASYFDFFLLSYIGYKIKRQICFLAAQEVLDLPLFKFFLRLDKQIKGIGFSRSNPGIDYFKEAVGYLKQGKIIVLFPEGTRSPDGNLGCAKIGFVKLALETQTPILPLAIQGAFQILPRYDKIPRIKKCNIFIGQALSLNKYYNKDLKREDFQKIADSFMREIKNSLKY